MKELVTIQTKLKAPKGQYNKFGGYAYRSCEDILEAVKPLLAETGCTLTISDNVICLEDRIYIVATATIKNATGEKEEVTAYAREPKERKGMDDSQITGASSSYARKYALNGLFCIDDNKDPDATNDHGKGETKPAKKSKNEVPEAKEPAPEIPPVTKAIEDANAAQDKATLTKVWNYYKGAYGDTPEFRKLVAQKNKAFKAAEEAA